LLGLQVETIYVNWVPQSTGLHRVVSGGVNYMVYVSDSEEIFPVPELSPFILTSAGIVGLVLISRRYKK
jgi:hypothetical protein